MKRRLIMGVLAAVMLAASGIAFGAPAEARHRAWNAGVNYGYWDGYAYRPDLPATQNIYGVNPYANYYGNYYWNRHRNWNRRSYNWWY